MWDTLYAGKFLRSLYWYKQNFGKLAKLLMHKYFWFVCVQKERMGGKYLSNKKKDVEKIEIFFSFLSLFPKLMHKYFWFVCLQKEGMEVCILAIKRKMSNKLGYFFLTLSIIISYYNIYQRWLDPRSFSFLIKHLIKGVKACFFWRYIKAKVKIFWD